MAENEVYIDPYRSIHLLRSHFFPTLLWHDLHHLWPNIGRLDYYEFFNAELIWGDGELIHCRA